MSLYRETSARSRKTIAGVVLGALVLVAIGFTAGRATAPEPSLQSQVADVREQARPVADALELVAIHYDASAEAAGAQLERAVASFEDVEDELALLDPSGTTAARTAIEELSSLVSSGASAAEVEQAAADAESSVRAASGDSS
jgi:HAMP domain-containing protein